MAENDRIIGSLESRMDNLEKAIDNGFTAINKQFDKINYRLDSKRKDDQLVKERVTTVESWISSFEKSEELKRDHKSFWATNWFRIPAFLLSIGAVLAAVAEIFYQINPKG